MAFISTALQPGTYGFTQLITGDVSACEEILAAPGAGKFIVLETLAIYCLTTKVVTVGAGETDGAVSSPILGPLQTDSTMIQLIFPRGIRLAANTALTIDSDGTDVCVLATGRIGP